MILLIVDELVPIDIFNTIRHLDLADVFAAEIFDHSLSNLINISDPDTVITETVLFGDIANSVVKLSLELETS